MAISKLVALGGLLVVALRHTLEAEGVNTLKSSCKAAIGSHMSQNTQAWIAFLISSVLIVGTLMPVVNYGFLVLYFPVFLMFGCDSASGAMDCLRILATPFVPFALTIVAFIACRIAIERAQYVAAVLTAASACAGSWLLVWH